MSLRQAILKISGFFSITSLESTDGMSKAVGGPRLYLWGRSYLCSAEKRLLGANSTGPLGRTVPLSLTH